MYQWKRYQASAPEKGGTRLVHFRLPTTVSVDLLAVGTEGLHVVYKGFNASCEQDQIARK